MGDIFSRLKKFIDYLKVSNNEFGRSIGCSSAQTTQMLTHKKNFGIDKLLNIVSAYPRLNPNWLLTGEGPMLKDEQVQEEVSTNTVDTSYIYDMYKDYKNMQDSLNIQIKELHAKIEKQNDTIMTLIAEKKDLEVRLGILDPLQLPPAGDVLQKKSLLSQIQPIASAPVRIEKRKSNE